MKTIAQLIMMFYTKKCLNNKRSKWQGKEVNMPMYEVTNLFFTFDCNNWSDAKAQEELMPQTEWCETHFTERIGGEPLNPPPSHILWNCKTEEYLSSDNKFSHTYPERFWPKTLMPKGIRFNTSDYNDIKELLKKDLYTRQCFMPIFFNEDITAALKSERVPCTLGYYFYYENEKLHCNYVIRSIDVIRHLSNDLYLTYLLLRDLTLNLKVNMGSITLIAFNAHCFANDEYTLKQRIKKWGE